MRVLLLAVMLAGCSAPGPERVTEPRVSDMPAARGPGLLRDAMLTRHNVARRAAGVPPLTWSRALAVDAARYAAVLARTGVFRHSTGARGVVPEGENLFTGTRGAYRYDEMVDLWVAEKKHFRDGVTPDFSTTGRWEDVAHFTQIVWRRTTQVGCALASNRTDDFLVCRYTPPGNVVGQRTGD